MEDKNKQCLICAKRADKQISLATTSYKLEAYLCDEHYNRANQRLKTYELAMPLLSQILKKVF